MADADSVTFSVTVNFINQVDNSSSCALKNAIRKFHTTDTWFDVFDISTETVENLEKYAKVEVASNSGATVNVFDANPYDPLKILTDFDPSLKYVTMNVKYYKPSEAAGASGSQTKNANNLMMSAAPEHKKPGLISTDKARFSGCEEGWHGDVDIFAPVPVTVFPSTPNSDWENPLKTQQDQLKAQAIVYSFLQRNRQRENQELTTLCPAIGLSDTEMIVYWYDCKKDIMLQTPKLPFLNDECDEFYGSTILLLWFVLNNKSFCSGVTASMLATQFKADFYQHVGVDIQLYQDVKAPCKVDYGFTVHWEEDLNTDDTRYIDTVKVQAGLALPLPVLLDL